MYRIIDENNNPVESDLRTQSYAQEILNHKYPNSGYRIERQPEPNMGIGHTYTQPIERR